MYESHFQLQTRPFIAAPLVENYVPAAAMEQARQSLIRCVERAEGPGRPALVLSAEEMRFVYDNTPKDRARTDVRLRLALGAEIPRDVELFRFPQDVVARIPQLERFRYIVVDTEMVIVDPANREIALTISP